MEEKSLNVLKHRSQHVTAGILWSLLSSFFSGIMINMVKHVSAHMETAEIIFFRNIFAFAMFIPIIMYMGIPHFKTSKIKIHILRSTTGLISMMIYFYTVSVMNISVVTSISFTAPLFTAVLAIYFFKDKPNIHQIFALFVGMIGVLIVVQPGTESFNPASLLVLLSTVFWALSGIIIKKLSATETALQTTFYMTFFMIIFSAPFALIKWKTPEMTDMYWLFGIALTSNLLQFSLAKSLENADFSVILPFDFTRLIFSAGIAYLIFSEKMDVQAVMGSVVILAAAFYAALNERRKIRRLTGITQATKGF